MIELLDSKWWLKKYDFWKSLLYEVSDFDNFYFLYFTYSKLAQFFRGKCHVRSKHVKIRCSTKLKKNSQILFVMPFFIHVSCILALTIHTKTFCSFMLNEIVSKECMPIEKKVHFITPGFDETHLQTSWALVFLLVTMKTMIANNLIGRKTISSACLSNVKQSPFTACLCFFTIMNSCF